MRMTVAMKTKKNRKPINLSLDEGLIDDARQLGLNISGVAEAGLAQAVSLAKTEQWQLQNKKALESSNAYVEEHGLPLAKHRQF